MGEGTLSDGAAVEERGCWSGEHPRAQISHRPRYPHEKSLER